MQPVRRLGVDAAILFSDIVVPLKAVGVDVELKAGIGPVIAQPFRTVADIDRLRPLEPDDVPYVAETVRILADALAVPLIGFAGAPFTLASYLVEGGPSRTYAHTKALMLTEPDTWTELLSTLADITSAFLRVQVEAGASAVQLFDSWAGALSPDDYQRSVLPASSQVFDGLADLDVPTIHFGVNTGELLALMADAGPDVVGVDWRVPIDVARERLGTGMAVQGNLDPAVCLSPWDAVETKVRDILRRNARRPGHIFNLGHGVLPETDPDVLRRVVDLVHALG
jgi:uroporphyrinogen decarboxylase